MVGVLVRAQVSLCSTDPGVHEGGANHRTDGEGLIPDRVPDGPSDGLQGAELRVAALAAWGDSVRTAISHSCHTDSPLVVKGCRETGRACRSQGPLSGSRDHLLSRWYAQRKRP